jgi:hypothetical protein
MALDDITLNSDVFTLSNFGATRVVRKVIAGTGQNILDPFTLEISHQDGAKNKPDRHMVKLTGYVMPVGATVAEPVSLHLVATVPKGIAIADQTDLFGEAACSLTDSLVDLISASTYAFMNRFINGGFE